MLDDVVEVFVVVDEVTSEDSTVELPQAATPKVSSATAVVVASVRKDLFMDICLSLIQCPALVGLLVIIVVGGWGRRFWLIALFDNLAVELTNPATLELLLKTASLDWL